MLRVGRAFTQLGILFLVLSTVLAFGQNVSPEFHNGKETASYTYTTSGTSINFYDFNGTLTQQFEIVVNNSPASLTTNVYGCMRGGTCSASLVASSGTASQTLSASGGPYDYYKVTISWTGGNASGIVVNRSGIQTALSTGGGGGSVTVSNFPSTQGTSPVGFGSLVQFTQSVTASAVALSSNATHTFCIRALPANSLTVYIGLSGVTTSTGYPLQAGEFVCPQLSNTNLVYVISTSTGSSVAVFGY
jgi:hypothetical protein